MCILARFAAVGSQSGVRGPTASHRCRAWPGGALPATRPCLPEQRGCWWGCQPQGNPKSWYTKATLKSPSRSDIRGVIFDFPKTERALSALACSDTAALMPEHPACFHPPQMHPSGLGEALKGPVC